MNLTRTLLKNERYQEAIDCSKESRGLYEKLGDDISAASASANVSICFRKRNENNDLDEALKAIDYARKIDLREGNMLGQIRDYRIMTEIYRVKNDDAQASIYYKLAKEAIVRLEEETHQPFTDTSFTDYLEFSDGSI